MRDDPTGSVTPGGPPAPLGARTARPGPTPLGNGSPTLLLASLGVALLAYAALAADVVHGGEASELDADVASWVARSMPGWAEWLARPFTWLGGVVGVTVVVATVAYSFLRRGRIGDAVLLVGVALGMQLLVATAKSGYGRARPDAGSPIDLPSSYAFPSGHAATGIAVFGLLGLVAASAAETPRRRLLAASAGFGIGALIGASRVVLNVHYVTDVLAGACFGLAWLTTCLLASRLVRR